MTLLWFQGQVVKNKTKAIIMLGIPWLKMSIWVTGDPRRTSAGDWRFDNLCGSHLQSHLTLKMAFAQVVERQSPTVVILRTPVTQMIMFNQRMLITPGFKPFTYRKYWEYSICKHLELSLVRKGNKVINFNLKFIYI